MSDILFLCLGIILGGAIGWFYGQDTARKSQIFNDKNNENLLKKERENRIRLEAELDAIKKYYQNTDEKLRETFDSLSAKSLKTNSESFTTLAKETLQRFFDEAGRDFSDRKNAIELMLNPLKEHLEKHEKLIGEVSTRSNKTFGSIQSSIEQLVSSQKDLEKETSALVGALKSPKVRGRWGEIGLKRIVEFSGMTEYCHFEQQVSVNSENGYLRPDMIIKMPDNKQIVVDSKMPLNAYLDALEATDEKLKKENLTRHSKAVMKHVKDLSSKKYWQQFDSGIDFVVLYIEVESAFGAALAEDKNLILEALENRIVFATPTTLIAMLQTVAYSWRQHASTENVVEILKSAKELYERMAVFAGHLRKIGGQIDSLAKTYNSASGSWESRVVPSARKIENLGIKPDKKNIGELEKSTQTLKGLK